MKRRLYLFILFLVPGLFAQAAVERLVYWPPPVPPATPGAPVATTPASPFGWQQYFYDHLVASKKAPVDLLFDGDSITDLWQTRGKDVYHDRFGALNPFDFGIIADKVENVLWRLNHGELDGLHPKLIVLLIGTNNINSQASDIILGITNLVGEYRKHCPDSHLLLLGIFPRGGSPNDPYRAKIKEVNAAISKLDDGKNITFLDIGAKFLQPDGTLTTDIMPDLLHPSPKGYGIWADAIQPIVDQYCPKASATTAWTTPPPPMAAPAPETWPPAYPPQPYNRVLFGVPQFWWAHFHEFTDRRRALATQPWDILFDGDELTAHWQAATGGATIWTERYATHKVFNLAFDGDHVENILWRAQNLAAGTPAPKLIVLQAGSGNVGQKPEDVAAGIKLILDQYQTQFPAAHVLLLGLFPAGPTAADPGRAWPASVNKILATYDDGKRVTFLDIGPKFLNPDGTLMPDVMPRARTLTTKGYQIWADAIQPVLDSYISK